MIFKIDGTDITPYIAYNGISWQREDIDGPNAGRDLNGNLIRDRVATKYRADITCRPLDPVESAILFTLIAPEWIVANNNDIVAGIATANQGVIAAIYSMAAQIVRAVEEGGDVYLDAAKVGRKLSPALARQENISGTNFVRAT